MNTIKMPRIYHENDMSDNSENDQNSQNSQHYEESVNENAPVSFIIVF